MTFTVPRHSVSDGDSSASATQPISRSHLSVYVLATSMEGTRAALQAAGTHARGLDARVVLLVPHVVPYAEALEHPAQPVAFTAGRFRARVEALGVDVAIHVCVCRPHSEALATLIPAEAAVLLGGRTRRWWPTPEQRLARALTGAGRWVLFVPIRIRSSAGL
jgi:hypothetical protein